jgi:cyclase
MLAVRVIPALLLRNKSLVKTRRFGKYEYIGDPINTARIFNELEVDELLFMDITASRERKSPDLKLLAELARECFMPLSYGGGVRTLDNAKDIFGIGFEKVMLNTHLIKNPKLITDISKFFGSQAVIASIDVKVDLFGRKRVRKNGVWNNQVVDPVLWAKQVEELGAGEILLTSVDKEGTWEGFDLELVRSITQAVSIPVVAHGGAGCIQDIADVVNVAKASAVALGSMVVYQKNGMGVLVNIPDETALKAKVHRL